LRYSNRLTNYFLKIAGVSSLDAFLCITAKSSDPISAMGHERPGRAGSGSGHVRFAPKATVGHENAIRR
jgi:hypothetical protein